MKAVDHLPLNDSKRQSHGFAEVIVKVFYHQMSTATNNLY